MKFIKVKTYEELSKIAADIIADQIKEKPDCILGLATGSTPIGTYKELIKKNKNGELDFSHVTSFNLDEYIGLDGEHDQSYRYFMNNQLFNHVNIDKSKTSVPSGCTDDPEKEGAEYDKRIAEAGGIDLQLLGIGNNGHIGFNEPDSYFTGPTHLVKLEPSTIEANARFFETIDDVPKQAITMGMASIMQAKKILLVASGKGKKEITEKAVYGNIDPKVPASILQVHHDVTVIYSEE